MGTTDLQQLQQLVEKSRQILDEIDRILANAKQEIEEVDHSQPRQENGIPSKDVVGL